MTKRILLIDDSPIIQAAATHALIQAGYEVATRSTFDELMSQSIDGFDLILMDVQMPELYGDDVAMVLGLSTEAVPLKVARPSAPVVAPARPGCLPRRRGGDRGSAGDRGSEPSGIRHGKGTPQRVHPPLEGEPHKVATVSRARWRSSGYSLSKWT